MPAGEGRPVWIDGPIELRTCPVRLLTSEVRQIFEMFKFTHELVIGERLAQWSRVALPGAGELGEQEALLMDCLEAVKDLANELLLESAKKGSAKAELEAYHEKVRSDRA